MRSAASLTPFLEERPPSYNAPAAFLRGRFSRARHYLAGMARADVVYEVPLWSVLDEHHVDQLLQKLCAVHGEARFDLAPELAGSRTRR
jgi:hypothetical protein